MSVKSMLVVSTGPEVSAGNRGLPEERVCSKQEWTRQVQDAQRQCAASGGGELPVGGSIAKASVTSTVFSVTPCLCTSTAVQGGCWGSRPRAGVAGLCWAPKTGLGPAT